MGNPEQEQKQDRERIRLQNDSLPEGLSLEYSLKITEEPNGPKSRETVVDRVMKGIAESGQ